MEDLHVGQQREQRGVRFQTPAQRLDLAPKRGGCGFEFRASASGTAMPGGGACLGRRGSLGERGGGDDDKDERED